MSRDAPAAESARVIVMWLPPTPVGSAPHTHLNGTLTRLAARQLAPAHVLTSGPGSGGLVRKAVRVLRTVLLTFRASRAGDVVVTRWHPLLGLASPVLRWRRRRVLLLVQGGAESTYEAHPWFRRVPFVTALVRSSFRQADHILTINEGMADEVERAQPKGAAVPIQVLPTGVSEVFAAARTKAPSATEPYAIFFGSMASWQGVATMVAAVESPNWPEDVRLVVIGGGEDAHLVTGPDVSPRIEYRGVLSPEALAPLVAGALCTLCPKRNVPSMAEVTTPFKVLESVAAGVPVIVTDIPAQRRLVESGRYGLIVPPDDGPALADAVARLHADSELRHQLVGAAAEVAPTLTWEHSGEILSGAVRRLHAAGEHT